MALAVAGYATAAARTVAATIQRLIIGGSLQAVAWGWAPVALTPVGARSERCSDAFERIPRYGITGTLVVGPAVRVGGIPVILVGGRDGDVVGDCGAAVVVGRTGDEVGAL